MSPKILWSNNFTKKNNLENILYEYKRLVYLKYPNANNSDSI